MSIYSNSLKEFIVRNIQHGYKSTDYYEEARRDYDYANSRSAFARYVTYIKRKKHVEVPELSEPDDMPDMSVMEDQFLTIIKKRKVVEFATLCRDLNCEPRDLFDLVDHFQGLGFEIEIDYDTNSIMSRAIQPTSVEQVEQISDTEIIFGVASDLHIGSKVVQLTALNEFCNICSKEGVEHIFCPGDVVAGYNVYPGQQFELYALSSEDQEESAIRNIPTGFTWYMLGGNHDYSFIKKGGGHNPILAIAKQRNDFHYVGFDDVTIPILDNVDVKMWHPSGGVPYSISYRLQKGVEQITYRELNNIVNGDKEKPTIRFVLGGHLHIQMQALFGSIFGAQCGTFEAQSNYLKKKGLFPNIGGYIIKACLGSSGLLKNFEAKFYVFQEVKDDFRNYSHIIPEPKIDKPIFE